jgi:sterol desaturase/sphingolipid hydroxylase (fatty acid hydroxylase superfamily)
VTYNPNNSEKGDIRKILTEEVDLYLKKFMTSLVLLMPILILMWIIPYTNPEFLVSYALQKNVSLYIFLIFVLSTLI